MAYPTPSTPVSADNATSAVSVVVPSGCTRILFFAAYETAQANGLSTVTSLVDNSGTPQVASILHAGATLSQLGGSFYNAIECWTIVNPTPGTTTWTATYDVNPSRRRNLSAICISGDDADYDDYEIIADGSGNTHPLNIVTTGAERLLISYAVNQTAGTAITDVGVQDSIFFEGGPGSTSTNSFRHTMGESEAATAGTYDHGYDGANSPSVAIVVALKPGGGGGGGSDRPPRSLVVSQAVHRASHW